ncbi:chaplin [Streptomyces collinus]|uniref:chaplin n=1 Tax=Streptomyces collinus TaxID=42684 RepID=UPI003684F00E
MLSRAAVRTSVDASFSGVLSGDAAQIPVHVPIDICGGTVDVIGELNPTFGNACVNGAHRLVPTEHLGDESAWSFPLVAGHSPSSSGTWWAGGGSRPCRRTGCSWRWAR